MKSGRSYSFGVVSLIVLAVIFIGCAGKAKKVAQQPSQAEKPAVEAEKPAPAVEKPEAAEAKTGPVIEKPAPAAAVPMVLKFAAGETAKYKVVVEGQRKVKWEGAVPDKPAFQNAENISKAEMIFTQKIQSVAASGNAAALITIDWLKYVSSIKETKILDFDSSRAEDANSPMAKLIGQSYTIEITPSGEVAKVIDVNSAVAAVKGDSPAQRAAMKLLESEVIKDRHGTLVLPANKTQLNIGESWKNIKTFLFSPMGPATYERIYTLKSVDDHKAMVEMKAVPTTEPNTPLASRVSKSFDHKGRYWGELQFDTGSEQIVKYFETLEEEWLAAKPSLEKETEGEPATLTMSAKRFYGIEKTE
jgi:hypothetical protein